MYIRYIYIVSPVTLTQHPIIIISLSYCFQAQFTPPPTLFPYLQISSFQTLLFYFSISKTNYKEELRVRGACL